jgi:hypothetical protein
MNQKRFHLNPKITALFGLFLSLSVSFPLSAQFVPPPPPDPGEPSGRPEGGGGRGNCQNYEGITPLVPVVRKNEQQNTRWGFTTSDRPTVWFYLPRGLEDGTQLEWTLRDRSDQRIYRNIQRSAQVAPGIVALRLPENAPRLAAGQAYRWALVVNCSKAEIDVPLIFRGTMRRVTLSRTVADQVAAAKTPVDRAKLYAKHGIWYDAITTLGESLSNKQDPAIAQAWSTLLREGGFTNLAAAPVDRCCVLK